MIKAKLVLPDVAAVPSKEQSDWNVNDPEEAGYVKNRTHYKEDAISYVPITESNIITFNDVAGRYVATINNASLTEGVYKVVIRGQEELYESTKVGDTYNILVTNPEGISFSYIEGTNFITVVDETATTSYQTSLSLYLQDVGTTYHKLGMEYIPSDEIADEIFPTLGVDVEIASESDDIVTLKRGIVNNGGTIKNSDEEDITLAKVAKTGSYNDLSDTPQDLATKTYVDTQISLNNAEYRGTSAKNLTEVQFLTWANSLTHNVNDYVFWDVVDSVGNEQLKLYQFRNNAWTYLFTIETAGFTQEQWDALDSGATSALIQQITTNQNAIANLATVARTGSYNDLTDKPSGMATETYVTSSITSHNTSSSAHSDIRGSISTIEGKIPNQASSQNQLADKDFVNSSINSSAAYFRGSYSTQLDLLSIAWQTVDEDADYYVTNNDYAYVEAIVNGQPIGDWNPSDHIGESWRFLYVLGEGWEPQFKVNNTPFTAAQIAAINSGATSELIGQITTNKNAIESLATVATTGSYNDLTDKPAWVQSDWSTNDSSDASYIANRTHYTTETVIIDSENLTFTVYEDVSQCVVNNLTLAEGYYKIRIRGVEGVYRCFRDGNVYTINIYSNPDNIVFTYNSGDTYTTIVNYTTVSKHTTYLGLSSMVITQLAEYYIPATVARVSQIPTSNSQLTNDEGYITASNNLSDVGNRQTALNNITNATTQSVEKVLSLGDDGNASWKDRFERAAGVTANEVSVHDHRGNFSSATDVYVPLMSFRHLNSMRKFQIEFSLMAADATISAYPVYYARYVFFRSTIYGVEGKFMCVDCASTDDTLFSMNDVVAVSSTEGGYTYTTFYKKNAGEYDWNMYCIHSMSTFSYNGQTGYVVPTYYVGSYATDLKSGEVRVTDSMLRHYSDFTTVYPCMDKTVANKLEWIELSAN